MIVRPDGTPLYNFASVVDDVEMKITHVVRAEEHLSNTFPQVLLFEALGRRLPAFAHVPYVAEPGSKKKLSKRENYEKLGIYVYLHEYREKGYLPEAMLNYLARLGWSYDDSQEIFTRAELIEKFTLDKVNSSPASHDPDKLFWIEGEWMKALPLEHKVEGVLPFLKREGLVSEPRRRGDPRADRGGDRGARRPAQGLLRHPQARPLLLHRDADATTPTRSRSGSARRACPPMLDASSTRCSRAVEPYDVPTLEKAVHDYAEAHGHPMGQVVNPLRVATTGQGVGPGPLRLPGDPRARDLPRADRGNPGDAAKRLTLVARWRMLRPRRSLVTLRIVPFLAGAEVGLNH